MFLKTVGLEQAYLVVHRHRAIEEPSPLQPHRGVSMIQPEALWGNIAFLFVTPILALILAPWWAWTHRLDPATLRLRSFSGGSPVWV